jgi:glutaredoxin
MLDLGLSSFGLSGFQSFRMFWAAPYFDLVEEPMQHHLVQTNLMAGCIRPLTLLLGLTLGMAAFPCQADGLGSLLGEAVQGLQQSFNGGSFNANNAVQWITTAVSGQLAANQAPPTGADKGKVIMYSDMGCPYCQQAKDYMDQHHIPYDDRDIANPIYKAQFTTYNPTGVPYMILGQKTIAGFDGPQISKDYALMLQASAAQQNPQATASTGSAQTATTSGPGSLLAGAEMVPKIGGVTVYASPNVNSSTVTQLQAQQTVVYMGKTKNGMLNVTTSAGVGWVNQLLMKGP